MQILPPLFGNALLLSFGDMQVPIQGKPGFPTVAISGWDPNCVPPNSGWAIIADLRSLAQQTLKDQAFLKKENDRKT